jgi:NAD(P)-dependent dehydrogenase (short-subunit alcohol dehydrogenase family)
MKTVLITGCSSGFGEAIALAFARRGDRVMATMRRPDTASSALQALRKGHPDRVAIAALDVTDAAMRVQAIDLALQRFGRLDVLVNNAAITATGSVEDTPESAWRSIFETNFFGPLELSRLALPVMRRQGAGRIVNITSVAAVLATPFLSAYCAVKHALDAMSAALDIETRSFGVRVTTVMPGPFKTNLPAASMHFGPSAPYERVLASFKATFGAMEAHAPQDLTPVVDAAFAAADSVDPEVRYTAGTEPVKILPPILQALAPLRGMGLHMTGQDAAAT